jgi:hypothetical protein
VVRRLVGASDVAAVERANAALLISSAPRSSCPRAVIEDRNTPAHSSNRLSVVTPLTTPSDRRATSTRMRAALGGQLSGHPAYQPRFFADVRFAISAGGSMYASRGKGGI